MNFEELLEAIENAQQHVEMESGLPFGEILILGQLPQPLNGIYLLPFLVPTHFLAIIHIVELAHLQVVVSLLIVVLLDLVMRLLTLWKFMLQELI